MRIEPVVLEGKVVRLEPLGDGHVAGLTDAARHDEVWTYMDEPAPHVAGLVADALDEQRRGERLAFAIVERRTGLAIGSISYIDIQPAHRGLEIGWAWVTPSRWRTGAARDAAFLLMRHAFDRLDAIRVVFKTDSRNVRSQRAIEGLGATREGVFRNHRILRDGYVRHSVYYSVIREEWPNVRGVFEAGQQAY
ncbi:GNAT family N-acetyltransferase [Sphaerisporangium corydalis]|uniref:GNAT family N-acetyltransferase n=1 Tax=Sphaerisporangium corydalis TaxID=1441875 RepID=A0ABV9EHF9_9ACTN|nr:GNAT family protein [Sphaerisporangium corydalis]